MPPQLLYLGYGLGCMYFDFVQIIHEEWKHISLFELEILDGFPALGMSSGIFYVIFTSRPVELKIWGT